MEPKFGFKELAGGGYTIVHLDSGDALDVELHFNNFRKDQWSLKSADFSKVNIICDDYQPPKQPEPKSSGVELQLNIDTQPFRDSLRLLGEDLIKMAGKS